MLLLPTGRAALRAAAKPATAMTGRQESKAIGEPFERHMTGKLLIQSGRSRVQINDEYVRKLDHVIGPDTTERGSVTGWPP